MDEWPAGALALYATLRETPPLAAQLADAVAAWLPERRVVAYNGPLLLHALDGLSAAARQTTVDNIAWHEYGHALSVTRASHELKRDGPRLVELLPPGLRNVIDFPGSYRPRQVFDEVIANVYALMIGRAIHDNDYGVPEFLHPDVFEAFATVVPWPPDR